MMPKNKVNNPNGKKGSKAHDDAKNLLLTQLKEEFKDHANVQVKDEVPIATYGKKNIRIADIAAFIVDRIGNLIAVTWSKIIQVGRTNAQGKPVKREQEAIDDIEKATGVKVEFYDYKNNKFVK